MKILVALSAVATGAWGQLTCYECDDTTYSADGNNDCWATGSTRTCSTGQFCYSKITWRDGFPQRVQRGCVSPTSIETTVGIDQESSATGDYRGCNLDIYNEAGNTQEHSQVCGLVCNTNDCNNPATFKVESLYSCTCTNSGEVCDFLTGTCYCPTTGQEPINGACATPVTEAPVTTAAATTVPAPAASLLQCLQCNSEIDGVDCANGASRFLGSCRTGDQTCTSATHIVVDINGNSVREIITRGCSTDAAQADTCEFKAVESGYEAATDIKLVAEVVCRYACTTDSCNTESATGDGPALVTAAAPVYDNCKVGTSVDGTGDSDVTTCEHGCKSVLTYLEAPHVTEYHKASATVQGANTEKILKYERMCATPEDTIVNSCTHAPLELAYNPVLNGQVGIGSNLDTTRGNTEFFTCTKVCNGVNCNEATKYPGRPTCHVCNTGVDAMCLDQLPSFYGDQCGFDEDSCEIEHIGLDLSVENSAALTMSITSMDGNPIRTDLAWGDQQGGVVMMTRRCKNTWATIFEVTQEKETDIGKYHCEDYKTSLSGVASAEDHTTLKKCIYRCTNDNCNFGPGLILPETVEETETTVPPPAVTPSGSSALGGPIAMALVLGIFSKWIL